MRFETIHTINLSSPASWENKIFLTLDFDWASDEVLNYTINLLEAANTKATWFVTHDTPVIERIQASPLFEVALHPNFNKLLFNQDTSNGATALEVVERVQGLAPDAVSVRSHSLTQNSMILDLFQQKGFLYDCNDYVSFTSGIKLAPWRLYNGLLKITTYWEDNLQVMEGNAWDMERLLSHPGLKVFNFHPIHVCLNTESMARYEASRSVHRHWEALQAHRYSGYGIGAFLEDLLVRVKELNHA